jgi:hypothetical protein
MRTRWWPKGSICQVDLSDAMLVAMCREAGMTAPKFE